jgi:hypothetical protein
MENSILWIDVCSCCVDIQMTADLLRAVIVLCLILVRDRSTLWLLYVLVKFICSKNLLQMLWIVNFHNSIEQWSHLYCYYCGFIDSVRLVFSIPFQRFSILVVKDLFRTMYRKMILLLLIQSMQSFGLVSDLHIHNTH